MISCALYICVQVKNQFVEHFIYKRKHDCALYFSWLYLCNTEISFILSSWVLLPSPIKDLSENCSSRVWSAAIKNVPKTEQSWPSDRRFPQKSLYTQPVHLVKQAKDSFCFILSITVSAVVFFPLPKSFFFVPLPDIPYNNPVPCFFECRIWCGLSESTQCALSAARVNALRNCAPPLSLLSLLSFILLLLSPPKQLQTDTVAYKTFGLPYFTPCSLCPSASHVSLGLYKHNLIPCREDMKYKTIRPSR